MVSSDSYTDRTSGHKLFLYLPQDVYKRQTVTFVIPEVYEKAGKSMVSPQLPGYTTVTIPLLNSLSLANHDMRKTWYCVCCVFWRDV